MALVIKDRVKETSTITGTGPYTLVGSEAGFQGFSTIGDGNTTYYTATNNSDFEIGIGTYTASGSTLARTTILSSSNSNNAVSWSAGEKFVFITQPAPKATFLDASGNLVLSGTVNGRDVAADGVLATNALPKAGGQMTGNITMSGSETVDGRDLSADGTKIDFISVTQAVNLDEMEADIAALANGMVYKGDWDASSGSFPSGADIGFFYYVSVAGTVDSIAFHVGDNIVAITDNASTSVFSGNWSKHDNTDAVQTVVGLIGNITKTSLLTALNVEDGADVTDVTNVTAAGAVMDSEITNLAQVKAFDSTDYATSAQGTLADNAVAKAGDTMTGTLNVPTIDLGDWTITETGTVLEFAYQGTKRLSLDSTGSLKVSNQLQADETIT
tara:strand:+ start:435 stop:1592 length:1158 start_codon:yes stop_codon:yes gene_type:complete